jgi:DNA polymerase III epsilon subunit-like protein
MLKIIIGDTETTGLSGDRAACEVGLIEIDVDTLEVIAEHSSLIDPQRPIEAGATAIHGITDAQVACAPTTAEYVEGPLKGGLGDMVLIGYRVGFDLPMLKVVGKVVQTFDVLPLAQQLVTGTANHKLQTLKEHFGLPGGAAHRALGDCQTTLQLLRVLIPLSGRSLADHLKTKVQFISQMPFGKHVGKPLVALPQDYREWLLKQDGIDNNLRSSLEMIALTD